MSEWREVNLGEYVHVINGYAFKSSNFLDTGTPETLPIIKIKNVANGNVHLNGAHHHIYDASLSKYLVENKDVLIALTGNHPQAESQVVGIASRYKLNEKALLNQRVAKIVTKNESLLVKDFIYYYLIDTNTHQYLASQSSGSANQANISKTDIEQIVISLPCLEEQKAIASVLSSLDDKIDLLHRQNTTLERMAETLFRQWFVEEAQEDWEKYKFKDMVYHVKPGTNYQPQRIESGIPFLNVRNLKNGFLDLSDVTYISMQEYERVHKVWKPEENDVLISRIGTLGIVAVISKRDLPVAVHYNMINTKAKLTSYQFLYFLLKSQYFQELYSSQIRQSVQEYVAIEDIENLDLKLPLNKPNFKEKECIFIDLYKKISINEAQIRILEKLRDNLLPKLMSGDVRVMIENEEKAA